MDLLIGFIVIGITFIVLISPIILFIALIKRIKRNVVFEEEEEEIEERYLPYHAKKYFFSNSEQQFFNILNAHIDAQRYTIFPKVRLGDFIEVDYTDRRDRTWWNKIRAKHIDYLIWDLFENNIVLAIELDGNSHNSDKMQLRDDFVNDLYKKIGLRLERIRVGSSFEEESARIAEML